MSKPLDLRTLKAVRKTVSKRIAAFRDKRLNENLGYFCGSLAQAYRAGVEEAQQEMCARVGALIIKQTPDTIIPLTPAAAEALKSL